MKKHLVSALLCILSLLMTACSGSSQQEAEASKGSAKSIKIVWALCVESRVVDTKDIQLRAKTYFPNIDLEFLPINRLIWQEKLNALIAAGDIPDIMCLDEQRLAANYEERGSICEITADQVKKYAPSFYSACKECGPEAWQITFDNGKNYGLPIVETEIQSCLCDMWRMDMLNKLGVSKVPETIEEAERVFELAFHTYPNVPGNYKVYGLSFRGKDQMESLFSSVFAAYGTFPDKWMIQPDGTLVWGLMRDGAKDALRLLARWYAKGYIDPGFVTTDETTYDQKIADGSFLMLSGVPLETLLFPDGKYLKLALSGNTSANLVATAPLKGPDGNSAYSQTEKAVSCLTFGSQLRENTDKLIACLSIADFLYKDSPETDWILYGKQGVDWKHSAQTNAYISLDKSSPEKEKHLGSYIIGVPDRQARFQFPSITDYSAVFNKNTLVLGKDYVNWGDVSADSDLYTLKAEADKELYKGIIDIICGELSIDSYDGLRDEWYQNGGRKVTDKINENYRENGNKVGVISKWLAQAGARSERSTTAGAAAA